MTKRNLLEMTHSSLNYAQFLRQIAVRKPSGFYRIDDYQRIREVLRSVRAYRIAIVYPEWF